MRILTCWLKLLVSFIPVKGFNPMPFDAMPVDSFAWSWTFIATSIVTFLCNHSSNICTRRRTIWQLRVSMACDVCRVCVHTDVCECCLLKLCENCNEGTESCPVCDQTVQCILCYVSDGCIACGTRFRYPLSIFPSSFTLSTFHPTF